MCRPNVRWPCSARYDADLGSPFVYYGVLLVVTTTAEVAAAAVATTIALRRRTTKSASQPQLHYRNGGGGFNIIIQSNINRLSFTASDFPAAAVVVGDFALTRTPRWTKIQIIMIMIIIMIIIVLSGWNG